LQNTVRIRLNKTNQLCKPLESRPIISWNLADLGRQTSYLAAGQD